MSAATKHEDSQSGQPVEAEELVRSLGEIPEVSSELRSRILVAASQSASESKRQRGWVIVAGFAATCAATILAFAFFGGGYPGADPVAKDNNGLSTPSEEAINKSLIDPEKVISSGMLPQ